MGTVSNWMLYDRRVLKYMTPSNLMQSGIIQCHTQRLCQISDYVPVLTSRKPGHFHIDSTQKTPLGSTYMCWLFSAYV